MNHLDLDDLKNMTENETIFIHWEGQDGAVKTTPHDVFDDIKNQVFTEKDFLDFAYCLIEIEYKFENDLLPNYKFNNCFSLEQVIEKIQSSAVYGAEYLTPEYLAASYVIKSAIDSGYHDIDSLISTLDYLLDNGAVFDREEALKLIS